MSTKPSLKEHKYIADLLLTVAFFVLRSSHIFFQPFFFSTGRQIKKVQSDDHFNIKNMNFNMRFLFLEHQKKKFGSLLSSFGEGDLTNF